MKSTSPPASDASKQRDKLSRRSFLRGSIGAAGGAAALAAALSPLRFLDTEDFTVEKFLQRHYKEMTPEDMEMALDRIRAEVENRYKVRPELRDIKAMDGVEFVYALHLGRCIGCRKCVHACVEENNQSRSPEIQYIRVLEMPKGSINVEEGQHDYDPPDGSRSRSLLHAGAMPSVRQSAVRQGVPGGGDLAGKRRHCCDRLRLVHRLPILRSRMSLLGTAVQLRRAAHSARSNQPGHGVPVQSTKAQRRHGEMPLLPSTHTPRAHAGMFGGLPGRCAQVR